MEKMNFDILNCAVSYFEGQTNKKEDINVALNQFLSFYQLKNEDLDKIKERYHQSKWKMIIFDNQKIMEHCDFIRLVYLFSEVFPFYVHVKNSLWASKLFPLFEDIIYHGSYLPMVVLYNDEEMRYIPLKNKDEVFEIANCLSKGDYLKNFNYIQNEHMTYFIHLSDLHFGVLGKTNYKNKLLDHLDRTVSRLYSNYPLRIIITGDLMNSPSRKNMNMATDFLYQLKKRYRCKIHYILGNHDVVMSGFNLFRTQKAKIVSYVLQDNIEVLEDLKVILIKLNSNLHGNFARGTVGLKQLADVDRELKLIENYQDYVPIVLIHHHPVPIYKADFLKTGFKEKKFVKALLDKSKDLIDSELLLKWMKRRKMHYILHGHQHIPAYNQHDDIHIIGAGSSTGVVADKEDQYLSYNVIQYDVDNKKVVSATLYYEDELNQLPKRTYTRLL